MKTLSKISILSFLFISCGQSINLDSDISLDSFLDSEMSPKLSRLSSQERQMYLLVNDYRSSIGKVKLILHTETTHQSQKHSDYMARELGALTHEGFKLRVKSIRDTEDRFIPRAGENIAYNSSVKRAHQALLNSPGHKKNIIGDFTHIGIGHETDSRGRMFFTQIFIKIK